MDAELRQGEQQALMERMQADDYEAVLAGWGVALSPDLTEMWGREAPFNFARYQNPALDSLFEAALSQPTKEAAAPYWRRAATLLASDQPYNWLYYFPAIGVVGPRLQGMKVDTYGAYQNVWEWRVEE